MRGFASAATGHPDPKVGAGEVLGRLLEDLPRPGTLVVAAGEGWAGDLADMMEAADALLSPRSLLGLVTGRVGADGSRLLGSGLVVWGSERLYRIGRLEPVGDDQSRSRLVAADGEELGASPLVGFFDGESLDRDHLGASLSGTTALLGEVDPKSGPRFFLGQDEFRGGGVFLQGGADDWPVLTNGYRRLEDYWAVTALEPELELGGRMARDRMVRNGLEPGETILGSVAMESGGQPRFEPPDPLLVPALGDLVTLWSADSRIGSPGLSFSLDGGSSTLGFGPSSMESSPGQMPVSYLTTSTSHQVATGGGAATISDKAYGGLCFR